MFNRKNINFKFYSRHSNLVAVGILITASFIIILFSACNQKKIGLADTNAFYTCSMHPQVMEPHAGKCPICGMDLIPVQKNKAPKSDEIQLSEQQIQLGNILIDTIGKSVIGSETVLTATLNYDQTKLTAVSSRVMGRVEKLYHKNIGEYIKKGDPLMDVYSTELNNAKQEYILALERQKELDNAVIDFEQVIQSAKIKLLLWGMNEGQIKALASNKRVDPSTTFYSTETGYITELSVQEGDYVTEGGLIIQLADLSTLWAEAQVYTSQFAQLNANNSVLVQLPDINKEVRGKIEFVNPEISADKRINLIRVTIPNSDGQLKPGMSVNVVLKGGQKNVLSLPNDAVLRDGNGTSVWIQTDKNTFKNRMVTVGIESGDRIEIIDGLKQGEAVVTRGAYLINSEFIFKRGASPMAGMKM